MRFRGQHWNGEGVKVALIDSGVRTDDPRLAETRVEGWSIEVTASGHAELASDFNDEHGQGTEIAAAIVRDAPGVHLIAVKVTDAQLKTSPEALAAGVETASRAGAQILVLALSAKLPGRMQLLRSACSMARETGALIVSIAHPLGEASYPADFPETLSVLSHPDCPPNRFFYFDESLFARGPWASFRGAFLAHGYTHADPPVYRGAGLAAASLAARIACLQQALASESSVAVLERLRKQSLSPDPSLGFS